MCVVKRLTGNKATIRKEREREKKKKRKPTIYNANKKIKEEKAVHTEKNPQ